MKNKKLVIVGDSALAQIAHEYFDGDSLYQVVAFAVESAYLKSRELQGLPVVAFETVEQLYPTSEHEVFVAVSYGQLNRLRTRLTAAAKAKGYKLASYISSRAFIWRNVTLGEHCFVFEDNTLQPFVKIGNNVVLWSGNHIGHHSIIEDNCFISSHVVVSGYCTIGANSFLGVNATIANNLKIGRDNWIGPGVTITHETRPGSLFKPAMPNAELAKISALRFCKVPEE